MAQLVTVTGPWVDPTDPPDLYSDSGGGFVIGNGYVITAGHIVYEYDHAFDSNTSTISSFDIRTQGNGPSGAPVSNTVALDFSGYQLQYIATIQSRYAQAVATGAQLPSNSKVEADPSLRARDAVLITSSGTVGSNDAGMVVFFG